MGNDLVTRSTGVSRCTCHCGSARQISGCAVDRSNIRPIKNGVGVKNAIFIIVSSVHENHINNILFTY